MSEDNIFIFYALISEEKNKVIKMQGPYIHRKPDEKEDDSDLKYVFNKDEFNDERKFLTKWLRERNPDKTSLFFFTDANDLHIANTNCNNCGNSFNVDINRIKVKCPTCSSVIELPTRSKEMDKKRQSAMVKAFDYFDKKYEIIKTNYRICTRKR